MLESLSHAEWTVIKGVANGGGSTSETLAYAFVTGKLKSFKDAGYTRFEDAWNRLDGEQQDAIIAVRAICHYFSQNNPSTRDTFVPDFIESVRRSLFNQKEQKYWDSHRQDDIDDLPKAELKKITLAVNRQLKPHL
ncbi:hypothetical protein [Vibrio sp. ABG19]|uniref:hypothetical protein n=1 Tax=Vibrio sp. ABG19 TaxID=2817385 RepID=UPI00249E6071|nr:hypothetical protein [Vibrio sp. ABG19]WGY45253.1 hypothetical protein J0X00_06050 [Vibrio sp. ABG19]